MAKAEVLGPRPDADQPISLAADEGSHWTEGEYEVWHLAGDCLLVQGEQRIEGEQAIVWSRELPGIDGNQPVFELIAYVAGGNQPVRVAFASNNEQASHQTSADWFGKLYTFRYPRWRVVKQHSPTQNRPAVYQKADAAFRAGSEQLLAPELAAPVAELSPSRPIELAQFGQTMIAPPPIDAAPGVNFRRVMILSRSDALADAEFLELPSGESAAVISGGVNVIVEGLAAPGLPAGVGAIDKLDLEADRVVIWTQGGALSGGFEQRGDVPLEVYMEGNIVFRQGDRTVYAQRMYYDVRRRLGVILDAELLTPLPPSEEQIYPGLVRLKAGVIEQLDASRFVAYDALITTSRLEVPSYHLGADVISFQDQQQPIIDPFTGQQAVDAAGTPLSTGSKLAQSEGNKVYLNSIPIFYWPRFSTNLEEPTFYINNIRVGNDSVFGFQTLIGLDMFQLLGIQDPPPGVDWDLSLDYLSERGFGVGTEVEYMTDRFYGFEGPTAGLFSVWGIDDEGLDNLGLARRAVTPEAEYRGRVFWNHQQRVQNGLLAGWTVQAEVGLLSDRTFLEQYYEQDWDNRKDEITGIRLRRIRDNRSLMIESNIRVNDFFTQTQSLPRLDHWMIGESVFGDTVTWNTHTSVGYLNLKTATPATSPQLAPIFELLPYEQDTAGGALSASGERLLTRQSLDLPLDFAPVKVVPFVLGEVGHWGEASDGDDLQRAYYQAGIRASIPFWTANPLIRDPVFNLNGLAHKVVFDIEASFSEANREFTELPLYDEIDDDAIEEIRRLLFFSPFGGSLAGTSFNPVPSPSFVDPRFDPRFYLFRTGTQSWVSSPAAEIVDDLAVVRLGMRHRLQTKRGGPGREQIVDWLTFDSNLTYFPDSDRDNFGEDFGLADYDFRWHLGDRFTVVSDGAADFFADGLKTASGGVVVNRPEVGNAYLGYRSIRGPFTADVLTAAFNYRISPKWIGSATSTFDFAETGSIGQRVAFSRIGESLIATLGLNVDTSKNNVGVNFLVEPRFLPNLTVTKQTGIYVPPTGYYGLE